MPIDKHCALLITPAERHGTIDASRLRGSLANWSVGTAEARKVIVEDGLLQEAGEAELRRVLHELRAWAVDTLEMAAGSRTLVEQAYETTGLEPPCDSAGRIPPFKKR